MISYRRLQDTMRKKGVTQYALINIYHVSPGQITRLRRNESVSTHTIDAFYRILECNVEDIMEDIPDSKKEVAHIQDKEDLDAYIAKQTIIPGKASRETAKDELTRRIKMKNGCTKIPRRTE